jgi:hypothetical protein
LVQHFRLALDNINVIRAIKDEGIAARGQIIREIKATTTQFGTADFVHENIRSNMDAHTIARSKICADFGRQVLVVKSSPRCL